MSALTSTSTSTSTVTVKKDTISISSSPILILPSILLSYIFSFLSSRQLILTCRRICHAWKDATRHICAWSHSEWILQGSASIDMTEKRRLEQQQIAIWYMTNVGEQCIPMNHIHTLIINTLSLSTKAFDMIISRINKSLTRLTLTHPRRYINHDEDHIYSSIERPSYPCLSLCHSLTTLTLSYAYVTPTSIPHIASCISITSLSIGIHVGYVKSNMLITLQQLRKLKLRSLHLTYYAPSIDTIREYRLTDSGHHWLAAILSPTTTLNTLTLDLDIASGDDVLIPNTLLSPHSVFDILRNHPLLPITLETLSFQHLGIWNHNNPIDLSCFTALHTLHLHATDFIKSHQSSSVNIRHDL